MRRRTQMPVVLQPADSGFNSHLRGGAAAAAGGGDVGGGGGGGGSGGSSRSATPVPFLRVLYEREVATLSMPHLKSLDIELQVYKYLPVFLLLVILLFAVVACSQPFVVRSWCCNNCD